MRADKVIAKVRELAAKYPNAIYQSDEAGCEYDSGNVVNGPPEVGCLFGQALRSLEFKVPSGMQGTSILEVLDTLGFEFDSNQEHWMEIAQEEQDTGTPWGEAVKAADTHRPLGD